MPDTDTVETPEVTTPTADADTAVVTTDPPETAHKDELGEAGKAALEKERVARKNAEKAARDVQKRLDAIEAEKLSETEKLQRKAEEGQSLAAKATDKLRRANLLSALAEQGLAGGKAKAAARLLDDVVYDDDDEPTNLADALTAAKATFGEELFTAAKADPPGLPDLHQGARSETPAKPESTGWFPNKIKS